MKKQFALPLFAALILLIMSFSVISDYRVEKKTAEVRQIEGIYIFFCAEPVMQYNYLGTARVNITADSDSDTRIHAAIKKAKKKYPIVEAIVFREVDLGSCDCITFKE